MKRRRLKFVLKKEGEHILKPCRCYHLMAVDTDGNFSKVLYFRNVDFSELSHGNGKSFDTVNEDIFSDDLWIRSACAPRHY